MTTPHTPAVVRQFDTLFSPLETTEQPAWLQRASAEERRQWQTHHTQGHEARRQAMQAFAPVQSLYTYNLLDLAPLDSATVTPDLFLEVQQRQQLDERYPTYLKAMLDDTELLSAKRDAYLATLREEYTIAQIKGHLSKDGKRLLDWIIEGFHDSSAEFVQTGPYFGSNTAICASLRLLDDLTLPGVVVLGADTDDAPCVVYMPGHPEHPLKAYSARTRFFAELAGALTNIEFQRYFLRFIPLRQHKRVLMHWLAEDAVQGAKMAVTPLAQGLRWFEQTQMVARLLDDARYLIPTTAQQAESLRDLSPVFVNAIEAHLMIGAGPGVCSTEEDEGRAPSDWVVPLRVIRPQPANYRRWLPDLSDYRLDEDSVPNGQPDTQGLYSIGEHQAIAINQAFYRVKERTAGRWTLLHPTDKDAYSPPLRHNGAGAWHHPHEHPEHWQRLSLLRRLGPAVAGLENERLLRLARVSSTSNDDLRAVYLRDAPMPALLMHVVQRARLYDEVALTMEQVRNGLPVPEVDNVPQLRAFRRAAAAYLGKEPAAQRVRRSDDPTPAPPDTPCEGSCNPPPGDLYNRWAIQLIRAIALHRFELAQLTTDDAVQELQRRYPHMPLSVAQRLLDTNRAQIQAPLLAVQPLPLNLAEQARALDHDARLSHALEGFTQPALVNQDNAILAVRLLEYLDNWPAGTALLLRGGERFGTPLAELGQTDVETTSVYLDEDEGWHAVSSTQVLLAQDMGEFGFYRALLHALGAPLAARLGFGLNEPQRLHQQLMQMALARPTRSRLLLGMPVQRSWLTNAAIVQQQRAPNRRDQNLFNREPLYTRLERLLTAHRLTLPRRQVNAYITHLLRENEPLGAHMTLLEQERLQLDGSLDRWVEQSPNAILRVQRADVARQLVHAWECRITQMPATVQVEYPQQDELPPLPVPLPAVVVLSVSRALPLDTLSTWLQQFPNLHQLELINLPLTEVPQGLQQLRRLSTLDLSRTQLAPSALSTLANLGNLRTLVLNFIDLPEFHWRVRDMTRLLAGNTVRTLTMLGAGASFEPGVFAVMQPLTHLSLAQNRIRLSAQDVIDLGGLHRLVSLDLSANPLTLMPDLTAMRAIENLDLSYLNSTLADWPLGLERLPNLQRANLRGLVITSVPDDAGRTRGLTMSSEHLPPAMRETFEEDVIASGSYLENSDESSEQLSGSDSNSDSEASNEVDLSAAQFTSALQNAPGLFEGMSDDEQVQARQLLDDTGSSVREFFALLLRQHQVFPSGPKHTAMRLRIQALIRGAFSQSLRAELYEQARDAVSCIDRDAIVFSQMENLLQASLALAKVEDSAAGNELVALATSHWRALRLRECLSTQVRNWRQPGRRIDYSEIELYFRIALSNRLGLRDQPSEQVFTSYTSWVTQDMLDETCEAVLASQADQLPAYLYAQVYWQRYLDFAALPQMAQINRWRARIGEYLDAVSSEELPPVLNQDEQDRLRDMLHMSGLLGLHEPLPPVLQLNRTQYRAAYDALQNIVEQARMQLTRTIVHEPRPGPSSRS